VSKQARMEAALRIISRFVLRARRVLEHSSAKDKMILENTLRGH